MPATLVLNARRQTEHLIVMSIVVRVEPASTISARATMDTLARTFVATNVLPMLLVKTTTHATSILEAACARMALMVPLAVVSLIFALVSSAQLVATSTALDRLANACVLNAKLGQPAKPVVA